VARPDLPYSCRDEKFLLRDRAYADQYAATYFCRLASSRPALAAAARKKWPSLEVVSVLDLEEGKECAVVGTIYKEQAAKPSALDAAAAAAKGGATSGSAAAAPAGANIEALAGGIPSLAHAKDALVLEDAGARVALSSPGASSPAGGAGALPAGPLVTGVVVALRGAVTEDGAFEVTDALFRGPGAPPPPRDPALLASPAPSGPGAAAAAAAAAAGGDPYLALVSGLGAAAASLSSAGASWSSAAAAAAAAAGGGGGAGGGDAGLRTAAAASLAADLLSGLAGAGDDAALFARVARVVVAGGLVPGGDALAAAAASAAAGNLCGVGGLGGVSAGGAGASSSSAAGGAGGAGGKAAPGAAAAAARAALGGPLRDADALALSLAASVPLDVMPGLPDPTGHALPQQPLHACLLPGAASRFGGGAGRKGTLVRATNPHDFDLGGVRFLGTSGQNVDDVLRWSTIGLAGADGGAEEEPSAANRASLGDGPRRCEALRSLLAWGHLAPTAPDTLAAFPFKSADPFVMEGCPHVFFCGGGREFATATAEVGDDGRVVEAGAEGKGGSTVRLISVPDFSAQPVIVLVNLRTLDCHTVRVQV
jgi:DNA polymerase delta subunit 2